MYFHNTPKVLAEWLTARGGMAARAEIAGRSGTGIHVYLRPEFRAEYGLKKGRTILDKIADEKFDYVVLQVPAEFITGPEGEEHDRSIDAYCQAVRAAGGEPVIYEMGWGRNETAEEGRKKILAAAIRNRARCFAPCSTAWVRVREERPDFELQNPPDRTHPGTLGSYLNLCCLFAAITGEPPVDMPRRHRIWVHLDEEAKTTAREKAKSMEFDDYDRSLPSWMKGRIAGSKEFEVPAEIARYLETVAWEEYATMQARLKIAKEEN